MSYFESLKSQVVSDILAKHLVEIVEFKSVQSRLNEYRVDGYTAYKDDLMQLVVLELPLNAILLQREKMEILHALIEEVAVLDGLVKQPKV